MDTVFISSIMAGFEPIRQAARDAVESVGMRPIMAEFSGASAASAQRALLDDVARADVLLLILGENVRHTRALVGSYDELSLRSNPLVANACLEGRCLISIGEL